MTEIERGRRRSRWGGRRDDRLDERYHYFVGGRSTGPTSDNKLHRHDEDRPLGPIYRRKVLLVGLNDQLTPPSNEDPRSTLLYL